MSFCTLVARRVSLLKLLAEVLPVYVESQMPHPDGWRCLLEEQKLVENMKSPGFRVWFGNLSQQLHRTVATLFNRILTILKGTGIDRDDENFVIAWANPNNPSLCFKVPCKKVSFWAKIL